jgi:CcmD family protein
VSQPSAATASPTSTASPTGTASPDDRATEFRPVSGAQLQSGEKLLVEAYAAIWLIVFAFVLFSWRRLGRIDARIDALEGAVARARSKDGDAPKKKAS